MVRYLTEEAVAGSKHHLHLRCLHGNNVLDQEVVEVVLVVVEVAVLRAPEEEGVAAITEEVEVIVMRVDQVIISSLVATRQGDLVAIKIITVGEEEEEVEATQIEVTMINVIQVVALVAVTVMKTEDIAAATATAVEAAIAIAAEVVEMIATVITAVIAAMEVRIFNRISALKPTIHFRPTKRRMPTNMSKKGNTISNIKEAAATIIKGDVPAIREVVVVIDKNIYAFLLICLNNAVITVT